MEFPDRITNGDKYGPAMDVKTVEEAQEYFDACVRHMMRVKPCDKHEAEHIERTNILWWSGYYGEERRKRVKELYAPVFAHLMLTP
jgi:hypothetical protein